MAAMSVRSAGHFCLNIQIPNMYGYLHFNGYPLNGKW